MNDAVKSAYHSDEDEEGVADGAASLGPDGGPASTRVHDQVAYDDETWLDEEISDEELAALGEEDFDDAGFGEEDFSAEDFAEDDFSAGDFEGEALGDDPLLNEAGALDNYSRDGFSEDDFAEGDFTAGDFSEEEMFEDDIDASFDGLEEADVDPHTGPEDGGAHDETMAAGARHALQQVAPARAVARGEAAEPQAQGAGALVAADDVYGGEITDLGEGEVDHRPVPRISIHAFCETPATTELLEKAAVDRRLAKTHLTIHMGGVAKAIDQFQTAATPNLIILETLASGAEIFTQLSELAEVCDPSTKVIIVGQVNDIILYRELIRQGVSEYIVRPRSPLQLIKTIADLYVDPAAPPIGKTIAFVGARGGVGSSTVAHNVAWCTAEEFKSSTIILDLDLPFGTASLDFDQEASAGLFEALSSPERLDDVLLDRLLQKHTDYLSLFTAPSMLDRDYDLDEQAFETVVDVVRSAAPTVVVDVPHIWTNWSKRILMSADEIVITATPDLASFRNTKNLIDSLNGARPNDSSPTLVINQFDSKMSAVQPDQFAEHVGIEPAQVLAWEPQLFAAAATNAAPLLEVGPKTKTAIALQELAADLIGRTEAGIAKPKFSLAGLFKKRK